MTVAYTAPSRKITSQGRFGCSGIVAIGVEERPRRENGGVMDGPKK